MQMPARKLGPFTVSAIGLGCMSLSHAYGTPPERSRAVRLLQEALDLGYTHFDTAALYGFGASETLLADAIGHRRSEFTLASKGGMFRNDDGKREINGRPDAIRAHCDASLKRLRTDVIDVYYLQRWDRRIPIEESVGTIGDLVREGKVKAAGLSEVSAATLRKAHAEHPITAVQTEYSLWTRNPEIAVLDACRELGAALVAFSPVARGFLTGKLRDAAALAPNDIRRPMPRFAPETYAANLKLLDEFAVIAEEHECTMAQLALAWLLAKADHILPIPGTTDADHLAENAGGARVSLTADAAVRLDELINQHTVQGARYPAAVQAEIDTEEFAFQE
jgi:aryl-alcohol dehydrogenase-like predicted oxidoreductase